MNGLFDFSAFPLLETPRLLLRELTIGDTQAVFNIRSDFQVTQYNTGLAYERLEQAQDLIEVLSARAIRMASNCAGALPSNPTPS